MTRIKYKKPKKPYVDKDINVLLLNAVSNADVSEINRLIKSGADCNTESVNSDYPLHIAIARKRADVVALLQANGAEPERKNSLGLSPLAYAWDEAVNARSDTPENVRLAALDVLRTICGGKNPFFGL